MSAPDIDQELLEKFEPLVGDAHLTILLGAGASAPSGLPDWNEFARRVAALSGLVKTGSAADILLSKQDPTIVLEAARTQSASNWEDHLTEALYGNLGEPPSPSPLHLAAAGHYLATSPKTTLSTLNFDTLLESALANKDTPSIAVSVDGEEDANMPTVHHLHGVIAEDAAVDPVVGFRDYAELVADMDAWQHRFLSNALARGPILLAGTTYRDPDIRHWLHLILQEEKPPHSALVTIVREGLGLSRRKFNSVKDALSMEWEAIGLTALQLQDFTDIALVLRELQFLGEDGYRSPKARAQQVWSAHNLRLADLQPSYSDALTADTERISQSLGVQAHQGTLWLANGDGMLARWASEGTHYQAEKYLKYVPTGHDSPWIAGEAIGSEEVKLRDVRRKRKAKPSWKSVLAIPIFAGDGRTPDIATAVLTFGISRTANWLLRHQEYWATITEKLSTAWGERISDIAFPREPT